MKLTDEEIKDILVSIDPDTKRLPPGFRDFARAIEAALSAKQGEQEAVGTEWTACVKLPVTVHVRQQRPGETHVSTREGITPVKPDDLIMRGVSGEEYPIGREIFERTYQIGEAHPAPSVNAQLLEALKKIATVNAMDYEYQRWAKAAIAAVEGKV